MISNVSRSAMRRFWTLCFVGIFYLCLLPQHDRVGIFPVFGWNGGGGHLKIGQSTFIIRRRATITTTSIRSAAHVANDGYDSMLRIHPISWRKSSSFQSSSSLMFSTTTSFAMMLSMRDTSVCSFFQVGDMVQVVQDVYNTITVNSSSSSKTNDDQRNYKGRQGVVVATWEKCNIDPACCCAEQVDPGLAVRVQFGQDEYFYFDEEELIKVKQ